MKLSVAGTSFKNNETMKSKMKQSTNVGKSFKNNEIMSGKIKLPITVGKSYKYNEATESRTKIPGKDYKPVIKSREKNCNKCGFATFSLFVLYSHRYKCKGQLLGKPSFCTYCRRKFNFINLYKAHKDTCVRKSLKKMIFRNKLKAKHLGYEEKPKLTSSDKYLLSCPLCHASFKSKLVFVNHLKQQNCTVQETVKKKFSARKSFNERQSSKMSSIFNTKIHSSTSKYESDSESEENTEMHRCLWCKSVYPNEQSLYMHFKMNDQCAIAFYKKQCFSGDKKLPSKARKTISVKARKSFSRHNFEENKRDSLYDFFNHAYTSPSRSARKSLTSSSKKKTSRKSFPNRVLNQCPVCFADFPDTFTFYQHQKMTNHWGKATKSFAQSIRCPFCKKEFLHLKSRNAHVMNHSDRSEKEIRAFLKNCRCSVCSEMFVSELAKLQHMKIEHPSDIKYSASGSNTTSDNEYNDKNKMSSVPSSVKRKLRQQPNTCPVCSKAFSHTVLRNKHFNEVHLKIFECQFCDTKFKSSSSLSNHIQIIHGQRLHCKGCKASFRNELELLQHILKIHPDQDPKLLLPSKPLKNTIPNEKAQEIVEEITIRRSQDGRSLPKNIEYYCDVCDIGYQKLCGLQSHRQSKLHKSTLEKNIDAFHKSLSDLPSPSPALPRTVKQPEILTCSECSEDFTNIKDFVPHRLSHFSVQGKYLKINELNPYMCEICSDVLDSHSKVQLHLFWHLQVESTSNKNSNLEENKKDTIVPDRHTGQHVAKKSFSKPSNQSVQEVVIGGVPKPLFTCEACNVGFTTKAHHDVHVRKLCKKIKASNLFSRNSNSQSEIDNELSVDTETGIAHCRTCNFLFISEAKFEQHKGFCKKCSFDNDSEEILTNSDAVKSCLSLDGVVAGCVTCAALFDNISSIEGHIIAHQTDENTISEDATDVLHCALCNSLFSLNAFKEHKHFCKIPINFSKKATKSKHTDVLISALELKCAVAACVSCGSPFDDIEAFSKHLMLHQTNQIDNNAADKSVYNGETSVGAVNFESENSMVDSPTDFLIGDIIDNLASDDQENSQLSHKSKDPVDIKREKSPEPDSNEAVKKPPEELEVLRDNFSQLLCMLISDTELMKKLGYGKLAVDEVLMNVLKQMGQKPYTDSGSEIDLFRKNIKMLLGLCLKEQFLQTIGKDKPADEMVAEALNIFSQELDEDSD